MIVENINGKDETQLPTFPRSMLQRTLSDTVHLLLHNADTHNPCFNLQAKPLCLFTHKLKLNRHWNNNNNTENRDRERETWEAEWVLGIYIGEGVSYD